MKAIHADLLWTDTQPLVLAGLPVGRRVAVARAADGRLVVFSPLRGTPEDIRALRDLGEISAFVVPSRFHDLFYPKYFGAFPKARFLGSSAIRDEHPDWPLTEIDGDTPELAGFAWQMIAGMPKVDEQVFLHQATRTLLIADALFNVPAPTSLLARLVSWAADIGGGAPRQSRFGRMNVRDRAAFAASVEKVAAWDFDRIVPGHGDVIERDGQRVWREAFRTLLG
jgi:glyoxylase-like metal-dependent hydrolase (beta-lactamase superfamily II)